MAAQELYIDLSMPKDEYDALPLEGKVDHLLAIKIGSHAAGGAFALATPEQVAVQQARNPLMYENLRRKIGESLIAQHNAAVGILPDGYVRIVPEAAGESSAA